MIWFRAKPQLLLVNIIALGLLAVLISPSARANGQTLGCGPADPTPSGAVKETNPKGAGWDAGGFHYQTYYYVVKPASQAYAESPDSINDYLSCRFDISPPTYKGQKPAGVEFNKRFVEEPGSCSATTSTPDPRPPVYRGSHCRAAAVVDDAGEGIINGWRIFCVNMPDRAANSFSGNPNYCGYKINSQLYSPGAGNKNGWVEGTGHLFQEDNCPTGEFDGFQEPNTPFNLGADPFVRCDNNTFSWYKGQVQANQGGAGFYKGGVTDFTNLIGTTGGDLNNFQLRLRGFNSVQGNFDTVLYLTYRYPSNAGLSAICNIDVQSDITRNTSFFANFSVKNTGTSNLTISDLTMDNEPPNVWGRKHLQVQDDHGNITGILRPGETVSWQDGKFTAPPTTGSQPFNWDLMNKGSPTPMFTCRAAINVNENSNRAFIRVNGGDVFAGADFEGFGRKCSATAPGPLGYFQSSWPGAPGGITVGTIARQAHINSWGNIDYRDPSAGGGKYTWLGASASEYAVFSSGTAGYEFEETNFDRAHLNHFVGNDGRIQQTGSVPVIPGPTDPILDGSVTKDGVFANINGKGGSYGNFYYHLPVATWLPCVNIQEFTDGAVTASSSNINAAVNDPDRVVQYTPPGGKETINNLSIPLGKRKVVIINGDVDIKGQITYPGTYPGGLADVPYFELIATGKINIYKSTHQIDGQIMAFPKDLDPTTGSGTIDTCADADPGFIGEWPADGDGGRKGRLSVGSCPNQLVVNGTLTARRVYLKRTGGTISSDIDNLDNDVPGSCRVQDGSINNGNGFIHNRVVFRENTCAAELVNFFPEAYIANMSINDVTGVSSIPVTSTELPPIY